MKKVYVEVVTRLIIDLEEGVNVSDVITEMDYNFNSTTDGAMIVDTEIRDYKATEAVE
jgi:hypothetical protein